MNKLHTAIIHYVTEEGQPAEWHVSCAEHDDEQSMRAHAARFFPSMVVKSVDFEEEETKTTENGRLAGLILSFCGTLIARQGLNTGARQLTAEETVVEFQEFVREHNLG